MRRLHAASLALLLALAAGPALAAAPSTLADAGAQSLADGKPILIEIGAAW